MIRKNADWMDLLHERILESLRDDGPATPSIMALSKGIRGSEDEILACFEDLEKLGLILEIDEGYYQLTEPGEEYLEGKIDLEDSMKTYVVEPWVVDKLKRILQES